MDSLLAVTALVLAFLGATLFADRASRFGWVPLLLLAVGLGVLFYELARFDHGHRVLLERLGLIAAPIVLIFGGAAWGTRRFYGWPDLGAHPGRAALVALGMTLGMLSGSAQHGRDLRQSMVTGRALGARLTERAAEQGRWPASLAELGEALPRSHMGAWDPPPYRYGLDEKGRPLLSFAVSSEQWLALPLDGPSEVRAEWRRRFQPPARIPAGQAPPVKGSPPEAAETPERGS